MCYQAICDMKCRHYNILNKHSSPLIANILDVVAMSLLGVMIVTGVFVLLPILSIVGFMPLLALPVAWFSLISMKKIETQQTPSSVMPNVRFSKNYKEKVLKKYFLTYLLIFLIPFIILTISLYQFSAGSYKNKLKRRTSIT